MGKKISAVLSIVLLASMFMSACGPSPEVAPVATAVPPPADTVAPPPPADTVAPPPPAAPKVLRLSSGPTDTPTLDPSLGTDTSSIQIIDELSVGLYRLNEVTVELEPGMANSYTMSPDGRVYTFKLRSDIPWVRWNGKEVETVKDCAGNTRYVTAYDFEYAIQRTCDARTASDYAYVLAFALEGCEAFNEMDADASDAMIEELRAGVAAKALDATTFELTFIAPAAYNLSIASMWITNAQPSWLIEGDACTEARGERWFEPESNQSYGPFVLKEWVHDSHMTIIKNPLWPATMPSVPQPKIDEVILRVLDATPTLAEYEAGNMHVSAVPLSEIDRVKADPVLSKEYYEGFSNCTYYLGFNTSKAPMDNVHLRRALSLALDRRGLIDNVIKGGQIPAQWFCRPGMAACPTIEEHPDFGIKTDAGRAKTELQAYMNDMGYTSVDQIPEIIYMHNTSEGHAKIAAAVQQMWVDTLGIKVNLTNQEWAVYLKTIRTEETPHIFRLGWCSDYPDANNWLKEVVAVNGSSNPAVDGVPVGGLTWKNDTYEKLVNDAAVEQDADKRLEMYMQAENILVWEDAAMIPVYWYTSVSVTKPNVVRTHAMIGRDAYEKWDINP